MAHPGGDFAVVVREGHSDPDGCLRKGHLETVLESPVDEGRLLIGGPLLEQSRETVDIEDLIRFRIGQADLSVPL